MIVKMQATEMEKLLIIHISHKVLKPGIYKNPCNQTQEDQKKNNQRAKYLKFIKENIQMTFKLSKSLL